MTITAQIELIRDYPSRAAEEFRTQLEKARQARSTLDLEAADDASRQVRGIDRSKELRPVKRPTILRTVGL